MARLVTRDYQRESDVRIGPSEVAECLVRCACFLVRFGLRLHGSHSPPRGHIVPDSFVGICVATSPDPACGEYIVRQLREIGVTHVRLDYSYGSEARQTARFLDLLLNNSFAVLLHLVQPFEEARAMDTPKAQRRWSAFVDTTLDQWGDRIDSVEIGSAVNRRKWAGYTSETFSTAWRIGHDVARRHDVTLVGPNVNDFEPMYNITYLCRMRAAEALPDVHSNNLFVERAVEPERYDHKILGHSLAPLTKFNTIKKARLLHCVSESVGVNETWSTHVAWSGRRIDRVLADVREKQADYLARYYLLTAASGALARVYWGPMIGQREGIIDDGTDEYPSDFPRAFIYEHVYGEVSDYRVLPALHAMKTFANLIPGMRYDGALSSSFGLEMHAFSDERGVVHALWTMNSRGAELSDLYSAHDIAEAKWLSRDGETLSEPPPMISHSPVYAVWPAERQIVVKPKAKTIADLVMDDPGHVYREGEWRGVVAAATTEERDRLLAVIGPRVVKEAKRLKTLRDARNTVWCIEDPLNPGEALVVKRWLLKPLHKRALDSFKPSRARRSWNGASELLRRGVGTPRPVAFFEHSTRGVLKENFYICAFTTGGLTVRSFFTAYGKGQGEFEGVPATKFYEKYADFLIDMHRRGVHYRDMSPGNILVEMCDGGELRFLMVDTTRARFFERPATVRQSLSDLKRTCHPLHWEGRKEFVGIYLEKRGEEFTPLRQLPFALYDHKQRFKNRTKKWRQGLRSLVSRSPG